jgi:hypothetical protein
MVGALQNEGAFAVYFSLLDHVSWATFIYLHATMKSYSIQEHMA